MSVENIFMISSPRIPPASCWWMNWQAVSLLRPKLHGDILCKILGDRQFRAYSGFRYMFSK
jgi:hypothetical protein